jgi:hypothetical protein
MSLRKTGRDALAVLIVIAGVSLGGCDSNSCANATAEMEKSIRGACMEDAFKNTPLCTCCIHAGRYSMDDTCTCQPLIFDKDFCYYSTGNSGYPMVRAALQYAANVCEGRQAMLPYGDVDSGTCAAPTPGMSNGGDAGD